MACFARSMVVGPGVCLCVVACALVAPGLGQQTTPPYAGKLNAISADLHSRRTAEALRLADALSAKHKEDAQLHMTLGELLAAEKQYKPAQHELELAQTLQPANFEVLYHLGEVFLRTGAYPRAEAVLQLALKVNPGSAEASYLLAEALADQARPMDALALLVPVHQAAPANMDVVLLMAHISMSQHYYEDAIPLLQSALAIAPQRSDLHVALGESYLMTDQVDKSIEQLDPLIATQPSANAYTLLGRSYQRLGRFEEAKKAFRQGLKLDPANSECRFHLGFIAKRQGDTAEAEAQLEEVLRAHPDYPDALLELANIRTAERNFEEAANLLRKYVQVSSNPATGYYKLAMVERSLHQAAAADRDLLQFQNDSQKTSGGQYPNEHLFDYLDTRSKLAPQARAQLDITEITAQLKAHPDQPEGLYLLAESYFKAGQAEDAERTIEHLDKVNAKDYRALTGTGVLLARYHLYDAAIQHFQAALELSPEADDVRFDLANAWFRKGRYAEAHAALESVAEVNRNDDAYLALSGDVYAHQGDTEKAKEIFSDALRQNPDNDQDYLSLALLELRTGDLSGARKTLLHAQARIPGSGKILWALGLVSALDGDTAVAGQDFERAVDVLPEWPGSYSLLGVFYFQTGQVVKAREVLDRFKNAHQSGALDTERIEQVLARAPASAPAGNEPLTAANKQQLLQLALLLADRTL